MTFGILKVIEVNKDKGHKELSPRVLKTVMAAL